MNSNTTPAVYWYKFPEYANLGDEITSFLLSRHYGVPFRHADRVEEADFVGAGSNLNEVFGKKNSGPRTRSLDVVGAGFMHPYLRVPEIQPVTIHSVRGYLSRALLPATSQDVLLGDPGLMASELLPARRAKKYDVGFISHVSRVDESSHVEGIAALGKTVISIDFRSTEIDEILATMTECRLIVAQSLHGLIFADSLQLPNVWLYDGPLHCGGEFKFYDYFSTVRRPFDQILDASSRFSWGDVERATFSIDASVLQEMKDQVDAAFQRATSSSTGPWAIGSAEHHFLLDEDRVTISNGRFKREAKRPLELRQVDFEEKFDSDSLFFSVYRENDGVRLDGPPLWNLLEIVKGASWWADGMEVESGRVRLSDRGHAQDSRVEVEASALHLNFDGEAHDINVGPSYLDIFEGRRAIYTKSKNNDLRWIREWAAFYHAIHGVDSVLLYDNGSDAYSARDVLEALKAVPGIEVAVVVSWPFKFGPQAGEFGAFDSDFFEYVVGSNAQHRFLGKAASVTHCDIDELVITCDGRPIHEHLEESKEGYMRYPGRLISGHLREPASEAGGFSFENFGYYDPEKEVATLKWSCIPGRLDPSVQWRTHAINGIHVEVSSKVLHRHFHAVSTGWKFPRGQQVEAVPDGYVVDDDLLAAMVKSGIASS